MKFCILLLVCVSMVSATDDQLLDELVARIRAKVSGLPVEFRVEYWYGWTTYTMVDSKPRKTDGIL